MFQSYQYGRMAREIRTTLLVFVVFYNINLCVEAPLPVTITSDASCVVCVNTTITLTCNAPNATNFKWTTTGDYSGVTDNDTIVVIATPKAIQYTCTVTDSKGTTGTSSVTVASNASTPTIKEFNFNEYEIVYVGESINLTVEYSNVLTFKWYRFHAPLPPGDRRSIINYSVNGKNYSSLILSKMTAGEDYGLYIFIVTSYCGHASSVNVTLAENSGKACFDGPVPILSITPNQTTIRGVVITYECLFGGNFLRDTAALYSIYWKIVSQGNVTYVDDNSDDKRYVVLKPSQHCHGNNFTCCRFVSYLQVDTSVISASDKTVMTCNAIFREDNSVSSPSSLTVVEPPVLISGPHNVTVNIHQVVQMTCTFTASQTPYLSICAWSNKDGRINPSHKYHFSQTSVSGRDNQVACTLTVSDVTNADEGKYYCYCFYNESFWLEYHFPQYSNISSQHGETNVQLTDSTDNSELSSLLEVIAGSFGLTIALLLVLLAIDLIRRWYKSRPGRDITATSVPCSGDGDTTSSGDCGSDTNRDKELQFIPDAANGNNIPNGTNQNGTGTGSDMERDGTRQGDPDQGSQEEIGGDQFVDQAESRDPDHRYTIPQQVDSSSVGVDQIADQLSCSESNINQVVKIVEQPQDLTIRVKEKQFIVTLCCNAESPCGYQLNYKWYCLGDNDNLGRNKTSTGNGPLLKITMSLSIMAGKRFNCEVSAGGYTVLSRVAKINLETVWIVEEPKLVTKVFAGYSLELSCKAESAPDVDVTYRWYKCNKDGHIEELVEKCLESKMVISEVTHSHQGHYKCVVSPEVSSRVVYVEVMTPTNIKFTTQPPKQQCIEFGEELTLTCEAVCEDNPVNYQWYYNKQRLINANRSQLVISQVAKEDGGLYQCEVRSEYSAQVVYSVATQIQPSSSANLPICDLQLQAEETVGHATDKMALLIGNGNYRGSTKHLRCPPNDVKAMTEKLQELGFKTLSLVDVSLNEMSRAINYFCGLLRKGMYAVFYYSGHGLGNENTTYLMPIDANDQQVKIEEYINYNDARRKMQQRRAKVIAFLDCCRTKGSATVELKESSAACDSFANFCQIFACAPSCEAFEIEGEKLSFMTQTLLKALNSTGYRKKINGKIYPLIMKYYRDKNLSPSEDKAYARPWNLNQLAEDISLEDPIYGRDVETDIKDLLLELPKDVELYFNDPTMTLHYRCVRLEFQAEFSNSLMIYVSFGGTTLPDLELNTQELEKLGLHVSKNTKTSFRIGNLLVLKDAVQNSGTPVHLRFSFRMPHNITVTDKIELDLLSTLIDPTF